MQCGKCQMLAMFFAGSAIVTVLVILFLFSYPSLVRERTIDEVVFKNGSLQMTRFETTQDLVNLRLEFYVYNVTNPSDVVNNGAKIDLQEIGPFVYHEYKYKQFLSNNQTSGLIKYKLRRRYTLRPELSVADARKLNITWPNVPLLAIEGYLNQINNVFERVVVQEVINVAVKEAKDTPFITDSVDKFIFNGSKRRLFAELAELIPKEMAPKDNKFGLLYGKNDTWNPIKDYLITMSAGFGEGQTFKDLNRYVFMNDSARLSFWRNKPASCNQLGGTDGEFFQPFLNQSEGIEVFSMDICRKLHFKYRQNTYSNGVPVWKYSLDERSLQSGTRNLENACYCLERVHETDVFKKECLLDGLIDLSKCAGPNILASGAHFHGGSPELRSRITGISKPNSSIHEPSLYVEPNTGLTLVVKVPLQFNVRLNSDSGIKILNFHKGDPLIIPLLWVSEDAEMTSDQAALLKSKLFLMDSWLVLAVLGGAIILIVTIIVIASVVCLKFRDSHATPREWGPADERSPLVPDRRASTGDHSLSREEATGNPRSYRSM